MLPVHISTIVGGNGQHTFIVGRPRQYDSAFEPFKRLGIVGNIDIYAADIIELVDHAVLITQLGESLQRLCITFHGFNSFVHVLLNNGQVAVGVGYTKFVP